MPSQKQSKDQKNSYSISLTDQNFRYWLQIELDLVELSIQKVVGQKLFRVDKNFFYPDESMVAKNKYPEKIKTKKVALIFLI